MVDLGDDEPLSFAFETVEELVTNEYVTRFTRNNNDKVFYRLSLTPLNPHYCRHRFDTSLMAEFNDGTWWWCVGHIDRGANLALPKWEPKEKS